MNRLRTFGWVVLVCFVAASLPSVAYAADIMLFDSPVPGYRLEAEDYVNSPKVAAADKTAVGGAIAQNSGRVILLKLPFPHTSRPVTVYLRVRPGSDTDTYSLSTYFNQNGKHKRLGYIRPDATVGQSAGSGSWRWVRFKPVSAKQVGPELRIDGVPGKGTGRSTAIDSIILSTRNDLDAAALDQTPPLFPAVPRVRVSKTVKPLVIDGRGDDLTWKEAVAIRDFLHYEHMTPARVGTTARLTYDDQNLYVLFDCPEPLLKAADMEQDKLKARIKERDGKMLTDDSCVVFLQPKINGPVYEFTVNTLGTLLDAKMQRKDMWGTRDVTWNSSATVVVRKGDGFWTEELAIPLKDLGVSAIADGDQWRAGLVRVAQGRKETSSWNPSGRGAHAPIALGVLDFAVKPVGLIPTKAIASLSPGKNDLTVEMTAPPTDGVELISRIQSADQRPSIMTDFFAATKPAVLKHTFDVKASGAVQEQWAALQAGSMRPIYLSPVIHTAIQSSIVVMTLTTPGAYQVQVNDQIVAKGDKANAAKINVSLRAGANVIAVRAEAGIAKLALDAPELKDLPHQWRTHNADTPKAMSAALDDRAWPLAKPAADGMIGQSGKPIVLRRTILLHKTLVWPVPEPALYVAGNSTQQVNFLVEGLKGKKLEHWTTFLAVPEGLKVAGVTGYYGHTNDAQPIWHYESAGQTTLDGKSMSLYKITADKPVRHIIHSVMSLFQVMLQISDPAQAKSGVSWQVHYWSQADDGSMVEPPQSFEVRALPPLAGKQPKKFLFQLWGSYFGARMDNEAMRRATLATMQAAGINQVTAGDTWTAENGPKYGVSNQLNVTYKAWSINLAPFLKEHPDARLIDSKGKPDNQHLCTTLLVGKDWPAASKILAGLVKDRDPALVMYDYEYNPVTGPHSCYCPRCLAAFRQRAKLSADVKLTPRIIEDKYLDQWEDFMAWRAAEILAHMKQTVHDTAPGVPFATYSLVQSPRTRAVYGIDWRYIGQMESVDIAEVGYGRPLADMRATEKALDGIPIMYGVWIRPYSPSDMRPGMVMTQAEVLRRALDSTAGVLLYDRNPMDGRSWLGVAKVTRLVAAHEPLFLKHDLQAIDDQDSGKVQILKGDKTSLVCVMNESSKPVAFSFQLPPELGGGHEFYSGQPIAAGARVSPTVQPGEATVYVLER